MAIEDEMVRFIAKIDLDPEDAAAFTKGLKDANDQCEYLRSTIAETAQKMVEMRARGEENSDEFKTLKSNLEDARNELKAVTKESEKYSSALGLNQMSMKQLQQHFPPPKPYTPRQVWWVLGWAVISSVVIVLIFLLIFRK